MPEEEAEPLVVHFAESLVDESLFFTHRLLEKLPEVKSFKLGDQTTGSWGATLVWLKPLEGEE